MKVYKSRDSVSTFEDITHFPKEFLNKLDYPNMPPHELKLK